MKKLLIGLVVVILLIGGGYYVARKAKHMMAPAPAVQQQAVATSTPAPTASQAAQVVTVVGTEFAFQPSTFTVTKGKPVTVTFKNEGKYPHNFTVTELGVKTATIQPGETTSLTFTPDKTGTFTYECTVPGHADRGMTGTLTVQ